MSEKSTSSQQSETARLMMYDARKKSVLVAYIFWFFFGWAAGHRLYMRKFGTAILQLLLPWIFVLAGLVIHPSAFFLLIIPAIWFLLDAFLIPGMIRKFNMTLVDSLS